MATAYIFLQDNDMLIELDELRDSADDSYLNASTVTATIKDSDGVAVTGQTLPITLSYVAASNGKYQGVFDSDLAVVNGDIGTIEITATEGTLQAFWRLQFLCRYRQL